MCNYETRFKAQIFNFNFHNASSIPNALVALMLLENSNVDDNQRVSILAAAVSNAEAEDGVEPNL